MTTPEDRIAVPRTQYASFENVRDGLREIVLVNATLLAFEYADDFPWRVLVTIDIRDLGEDGMPTDDENRLLSEMGDAIDAAILASRTAQNGPNAVFIARRTFNAIHDLRYQAHDADIIDAILEQLLASRQWPRPWTWTQADDDWYEAECLFQRFAQSEGRVGKG